MSEPALKQRPRDELELLGEEYEKRRISELNALHQELRDQAQALFAAVKGRYGLRPELWQDIFRQARISYDNGRFLIVKLGAERYLEPQLTATLAQLRRDLLAGIQNSTAADTMMADTAIAADHYFFRVQGWIGNLCLVVERELFGQEPLKPFMAPP